jgi:heme-degrading monooxygenase HmoA
MQRKETRCPSSSLPSRPELRFGPNLGLQVYRALAPDARFRYLTVGDRAPRLADDATALSGRYEIVHTRHDAAAPFAPDDPARPVTFLNCMVVRPGDEDAAFAVWREVNAYMVTKPGYRWHRLHRRVDADAPFGLINVARWESADAWRAAHDGGFRALAARPDLPFTPVPTLCELVDDPELAAVGARRVWAQ